MIEGKEASLLIRGDAATPDGIARYRYILVREGRIVEISRWRPPLTEDLPLLETEPGDLIFPGLLNLHTHSTYNFLPLWSSPEAPFRNRFEWRSNPDYRKEVSGVARTVRKLDGMAKTASVLCELQAVAGGTAVLQEDYDLEDEQSLGGLLLCRDTASPENLGFAEGAQIQSVVDFFEPDKATGKPVRKRPYKGKYDAIAQYARARDSGKLAAAIVHLAEGRSGFGSNRGVDPYSRAEFEAFMALPEMADAEAVRQSPFAVVHGCGIDAQDPAHVKFLRERAISIVWSPVSNLLLYGDTTDVETLIEAGINVALGSDWAPSGSKHIWDEAKFARAYFDAIGSAVPDNLIFDMVTVNAARCLGSTRLGRIAEGALADFFILRSPIETDNPHEVFLGTEDRHVLATIIGGRPIYGDRKFLSAYGDNLQRLPKAEGSAVKNKAVHLPTQLDFNVDEGISQLEANLKALDPPIWRSNLLVSSDKLYRRRVQRLKAQLQHFGWGVQVWRHDGPSATPGQVPVAPDAVRVWRGFRNTALGYEDFEKKLGSIFMPCAVAIQQPLGLTAYLPALLKSDKPAPVPDEIALVFFEDEAIYKRMFSSAGGRAYALLHGTAFDGVRSKSGFPARFEGYLEAEKPLYLVDGKADWQTGTTQVFVGSRPDSLSPADFLAQLAQAATALRADLPVGLDAAIVSPGADYVIWWHHWQGEPAADRSPRELLADLAEPQMDATAQDTKAPPTIFWESGGVALAEGDALNFVFPRREATPW